MKLTIEDYMKMSHKIEIIPDAEGGFVAQYPELPGCITSADSLTELEHMLEDCKRAWLEAAIADNAEIYVPNQENYSGQFRLRLPKTMHKKLALHAKQDQISLNQYCICLLSMADEIVHPTRRNIKFNKSFFDRANY